MYGADVCWRARSPSGVGDVKKEPIWKFGVDYVKYVKRSYKFLRTVRTFLETGNCTRFFFWGGHGIVIANGIALSKLDRVLQGVMGCLFSRAMPDNLSNYM